MKAFNPRRYAGCSGKTSREDAELVLFEALGHLALKLGAGPRTDGMVEKHIAYAKEHLCPDICQLWLRAVAREFLLAGTSSDDLPPTLQSIRPFQGSECKEGSTIGAATVPELLKKHRNWAAALAPLTNREGSRAGWVEVWLPEDRAPENAILLSNHEAPLSGNSWQLAAHLASRVEPGNRLQLATNYVISGEVEGELIQPVSLGAKLDLRTRVSGRQWVLPLGNQGELPDKFSAIVDNRVVDLMLRLFGHYAYKPDDPSSREPLPRCLEFHSFVSNSFGPLLALVLAMSPRRVVLYASQAMLKPRPGAEESPARALERLIQWATGPGSKPEVKIIEIEKDEKASHHELIQECTRHLVECLDSLDPTTRAGCVFNYTNGSLLHRLALQQASGRFPGVAFVYREWIKDTPEARKFVWVDNGRHPTRLSVRVWKEQASKRVRCPSQLFESRAQTYDQWESCLSGPRPVLVGNSFPWSLLARAAQVRTLKPSQARDILKTSEAVHSFWGHKNTLAAASDFAGVDLTPRSERPVVTLDQKKLPSLNGISFDSVLLLVPHYIESFRPSIGEEVGAEKIDSWQSLQINL